MNEATLLFVREHRNDDVRRLALSAHGRSDIDVTWALQQIAGWQKATEKIPSWASIEGIVYPPHINLEQCSSEVTARYKARLAERLLDHSEATFLDLTGGFGVDFSFITQTITPKSAVYVEQNGLLAEITAQNFKCLGLDNVTVIVDDGINVLHLTEHADIIYLDPARRNEHGSKTYAIGDCTPNLLDIAEELTKKASTVIVKLSPMLDWHKAVADIEAVVPHSIREVHILSVKNECKELLLVLSTRSDSPLALHCVNDGQVFISSLQQPHHLPLSHWGEDREDAGKRAGLQGTILFLPNASIMKAGIFDEVATRYHLRQLAPSSHLFLPTGDTPADMSFPGKTFKIIATSTMNRRELKTALKGVDRANISVRNFPLSAAELRKRLRIGEGGDWHIFGTSLSDNTHLLIICQPQ